MLYSHYALTPLRQYAMTPFSAHTICYYAIIPLCAYTIMPERKYTITPLHRGFLDQNNFYLNYKYLLGNSALRAGVDLRPSRRLRRRQVRAVRHRSRSRSRSRRPGRLCNKPRAARPRRPPWPLQATSAGATTRRAAATGPTSPARQPCARAPSSDLASRPSSSLAA